MSRTLYIIGTGGFAKEVGQLAAQLNVDGSRWSSIEYLCEREEDVGTPMPFGTVTSTDAQLRNLDRDVDYVIGLGAPKARQRIAEQLKSHARLTAPNLVHPFSGFDGSAVRLGQGNIITRGAVFTCDVVVGDHNVFNLNCTVGHDAKIGSYCVINPGCNVSGGVQLEDGCLLGTGCQVLEGLLISAGTTLGAGSVAAKSIAVAGVYVGVPAKRLDR